MWIYLSLLVCLIGLLIYGFAANPKLNTIGLHMFWCGLLAFLIDIGAATPVHVLK